MSLLAYESVAAALPKLGAMVDAPAEDVDGHAFHLRQLRGRPAIVFYEDNSSTSQNQALKDELSAYESNEAYGRAVAVAAVADVTGYDYWPARGFARDRVRERSREMGKPIYCDFNGGFRGALDLTKGASNVLLLDREGRVLFAGSGPLGPSARSRMLELLRRELGVSGG